jgi:NAD+ kinase
MTKRFASNAPSVLVVYKKSKLQLAREYKNARISDLLRRRDISVRAMVDAHAAHTATLASVVVTLQELGCQVKRVYRGRLRAVDCVGRAIITVGGDGTVLDASHRITTSPILGVNSDPGHSVGFLCAADQVGFASLVERFLNTPESCVAVQRLCGAIDGTPLPYAVMNDLLVGHHNAAATSRYVIEANGHQEDQKSSGLWIATAAGSSAAMASAGGFITDLDDRRFQLRVREPFVVDGKQLQLASLWFGDAPVVVTSKMREGRVWLDGPYQSVRFPMGARLTFARAEPLRLFATEAMAARRSQARAERQQAVITTTIG